MKGIGTDILTLLVALAVGLSAGVASAAETNDWTYAAEFYLWGANIDIEAANGNNSEIRFTDLADNLDFAWMAAFALQRGRWTLLADLVYLDVDDDLGDSIAPGIELDNLGLEAWVITPALAYQLIESDHYSLHLIGGARYLWIDLSEEFDFSAPLEPGSSDASESGSSWDGIVGLRGQLSFSDRWYASYHFDVGTGDSDSTWQAIAAFGYRFNRFDAVAGYRYLDWEDTEGDALNDLNLSGFMAGVKFFF